MNGHLGSIKRNVISKDAKGELRTYMEEFFEHKY